MKKLFIVVLALAFCFAALPAFAQDKPELSLYGQVRMWTAFESVSKETGKAVAPGSQVQLAAGSKARGWNAAFGEGLQDDDVLDWQLQTNARFGMNVKWGNIGGTVEFGNEGSGTAQASFIGGSADVGATFRLFYGTWNFGPGTLLLGKNVTPYTFIVSNLCGPGGGECNGIGYGTIYGGRRAQATLQFGGFKFGLVEPETRPTPFDQATGTVWAAPQDAATPGTEAADIDQTLPRIEASYTFNLGPAALFIGGLYNTFDIEYANATGIEKWSVDSWVLGAGARTAFGPFYANATVQYGENVSLAGVITNLLFARALVDSTTLNDSDVAYFGAQLILGFKLMDSLTFEGGVIYQNGDGDFVDGGGSISQDTWVYYVNATWSPAKNVFIVPEIGYVDNKNLEVTGDPDEDLGDVFWVGIKWQINF